MLAKIEDVDLFNRRLQSLTLHRSWEHSWEQRAAGGDDDHI